MLTIEPSMTLDQFQEVLAEHRKKARTPMKLASEKAEFIEALTLAGKPKHWISLAKDIFSPPKHRGGPAISKDDKDLQEGKVGVRGIEEEEVRARFPEGSTPNVSVIREIRQTLEQFLFKPDPLMLDVVLSTAASHRLRQKPVFAYLVGPPSSGKGEHLYLIRRLQDAAQVSELTSRTLLSGYKKDPASDEKPHLGWLDRHPNPIMIVPDFHTVLDSEPHERRKIFSQMLRLYDGDLDKDTGMGDPLYWEGFLTFIAGITPDIYSYFSLLNELGPRFLFYNIKVRGRREQSRMAMEEASNTPVLRDHARDLTLGYMSTLPVIHAEFTNEMKDYFSVLGELVADARSVVNRTGKENDNEVKRINQEGPARVTKELRSLAMSQAMVYQQDHISEQQRDFILEVSFSSLTPVKRFVILSLFDHPSTIDDLKKSRAFSEYALQQVLDDLQELKLVHREEYQWVLSPYTKERLDLLLAQHKLSY